MLGVDRRLSLTLPNINSSVSLFLLPPEPPRQLRGLRRKGIILFYYIIPLSLVYIIIRTGEDTDWKKRFFHPYSLLNLQGTKKIVNL
jgi:hypothetical protein